MTLVVNHTRSTALKGNHSYRGRVLFKRFNKHLILALAIEYARIHVVVWSLIMHFQRSLLDDTLPILNWATSWQNQQNVLCAQRILRSACASAQSDQSSQCAQWVAEDTMFLHAESEGSDQIVRMPWLIWVSAVRTVILLVLLWGGSIMF